MIIMTALAILLLASPQTAPDPAEAVTLRLVAAPKRGAGELRYEGKAQFPDGIALKATLFRSEERLEGGRFRTELTEIASEIAPAEGRRVSFTFGVKDAGAYRLVVELREDLQEPDVVSSFKNFAPGKWSFDHSIWGDDFVDALSSKLRDIDQQVELALDLTKRLAAATLSGKVWKEHYPILDKELAAFLKKLDQTCLEKNYPGAIGDLRLTMRNLKGNAEAVLFGEDGACKGSVDYRTQKPTKTIHGEDFTFESILKDVQAAKRAAGCELLLWVVKDFRRAGPRPALAEVLRSEARRPGLAPCVESLEGFKDVDASEKLIREAMARK